MMPYSRQQVSAEDIDAVIAVMKSDFLTQGPAVTEFEVAIAEFCGVGNAVATCNATASLHLACLALGISSGDCVWVAATSFVASANCARYCGADVDFVDINSGSGLLSTEALGQKINQYQLVGKVLPKALIVVHLAGQSCDMRAISALCRPLGIAIIEDASHALGGRYHNEMIGCCAYSDCSIFSFHPVKPITSGEGGMLVSTNKNLVDKARLLASHGIVKNAADCIHDKPGDWYYEQQELGFNYRLSDIHAALGVSQLRRLPSLLARKQRLAQRYSDGFKGSTVRPLQMGDNTESAWHLYIVQLPSESLRNICFTSLRSAGFGVNLHYLPIPNHPYYQSLGFEGENFPQACRYAEISLSLPLFPDMKDEDVDRVIDICLQSAA